MKRINYDDYVKINLEMSSEMFLSILTLLQTNMPCSVNYYREHHYQQTRHPIRSTATHAIPSIYGVCKGGCWPCNDSTEERSSRLRRTMKSLGSGVLHLGEAVNGRLPAIVSEEEGWLCPSSHWTSLTSEGNCQRKCWKQCLTKGKAIYWPMWPKKEECAAPPCRGSYWRKRWGKAYRRKSS